MFKLLNIHKIITIFSLVFLFGTVDKLFTLGGYSHSKGSNLYQVLCGLIYLYFGLYILKKNISGFIHFFLKEKLLVFLLLMCFLSVFWSVSPFLTFRRTIALLGTTFFSVHLVYFYDEKELLKLLSISMLVMVVVTIVIVYLFPNIGYLQYGLYQDTIRGGFSHKNTLGRAMVFSLIILVAEFMSKKTIALGLGIIASLGFLLLSNSMTAFLVFVFLFAYYCFMKLLRFDNKNFFFEAIFCFVLCLIILLLANYEVILGLVGRDSTLTGRTHLWGLLLDSIAQKPYLGFGFGSFWSDSANMVGATGIFFDLGHAHNTFIDVALNLGLFGLSVFLILILKCIYILLRNLRRGDIDVFCFLLLSVLSFSLTGTELFKQNEAMMILFTLTLYTHHKQLEKR